MPLTFANPRNPALLEELGPLDRQQLVALGELKDGQRLPAERRFSDDGDDEASLAGAVEVWDVLRDGQPALQAWLHAGETGAFFRAGTAQALARVVGGALQCDDPALRAELAAALKAAGGALPEESGLLRVRG